MLLEKITPEEIDIMGVLKDPRACSEVLFISRAENFETLKIFEEDDFFKVRLYQLPMMDYSYLLAYDPELTVADNFKLKKNLGSCYVYCGRKIGKCEWENNYCTLSNGERVQFKNLIGKTKEVICLDEESWKLTTSLAYFSDNGIKPCYLITTEAGKEIILTKNHPLLTQRGWIEVKDLKVQNFIATPKEIIIENQMKLYNSSRKKWQKLSKMINDKEVSKISDSDILWDKIREIKFVGEKNTVAVQVSKYHNYISNDIISHNSLIALLIDSLLDTIHNYKSWITAFGSFDEKHVKKIFEPHAIIMKYHPFFKLFKPRVTRKSPIEVKIPTGHSFLGVNMNIKGREPGTDWESIHAQKIIQDEHQYETEEVAYKRSQSTSEFGAIERFCGITSFKKADPAGRIFSDMEKRSSLINLPEYISPHWNEERKMEAMKDYGGEDTLGYRIHVLSEVIDDATGLYQMKKVRDCYVKDKETKLFEVSDDSYFNFKDIIVGEVPKGVFRTWMCADFGSTEPTEIVIIFEYNRKYDTVFKYEYNISLERLSIDEQTEIFDYCIQLFQPNVVALDSTLIGARQILINLGKKYQSKHLIPVRFNTKIPIDFERDEKGRVIFEKGRPKWVEEMTYQWSVRRLQTLLYGKRLEIPEQDYKFDRQFNGMFCSTKNGITRYGCQGPEHLHQAFQTFSIAQWMFEFKLIENIVARKQSKGAFETL